MTRAASLVLLLVCLMPAAEPQRGHAGFLPTPERPVGLLGDGTGVFPGAEPPTCWDYRTGANVRWSTTLPTGGQGSPIVVGDRLFVTSDPDLLHCYDAATGELRWRDRVTPLDLLAPARAAVVDNEWRELMAFRASIHAVMYESYLLRFRIARVEAARGGEPFSWRHTRGLFGHSRNVGGSPTVSGHLTLAEEKELDAWAASVTDAGLAAMRERSAELDRLIDEKKYHSGNGYVHSHMPFRRGDGEQAFRRTPGGKRWGRRWATINRYGLVPDKWQEWLGPGWPTPASDGERLWVCFGTGQVACYTLDGERIWLRQFLQIDPSIRKDRAFGDRHCASPVLTDGGVVVMHGHYADKSLGASYRWLDVRCLDKETGAVRWQRRFDDRGGHDVPLHTRLRHGDVDLIVTNMGPVFRADDGRRVADLGMTCCALPTLLGDGTVMLHDSNPGGGRSSPVVCARFRADPSAPAGIACEIVRARTDHRRHRELFRPRTTHIPRFGDHLVHAGYTANADDFRRVAEWRLPRFGGVNANPVIAGDKLITQSLRGLGAVTDLSNPTAPRVLGTGLVGSSRMRRFMLDTGHGPEDVLAELERGIQLTNYHRLVTANPWPQGGRLYLRSMDDLFCIEDAGAEVRPDKDRRR